MNPDDDDIYGDEDYCERCGAPLDGEIVGIFFILFGFIMGAALVGAAWWFS
jgi:hypothetical protein